ncbi:putative aspartate aminotransferase, cytoplasmic 2 isoform X2 [Sminthopsis crassicaudata]|uniref:putative aspartate aminotransferase, cytoplasmic 2 isoform X2 n=1 Tax=Sminthopsis crassicaudata TaxID=9301 RepID=UPI003D699C84
MPTLSVFLDVPFAPKTTSKLLDDFQQDEDPNKVCLGYGVCMTGEKIPWLSPVVIRTLRRLIHDPSFNYSYLPEHGLEAFIRVATELLVGRHSPAIVENRIGGVHTIGGNGAILLGAKFLKDWHRGPRVVYLQQSQREQYGLIFQELGFSLREYTFWDSYRLVSDTGKLFDIVEHAPDRSILLLYNFGSFLLPRKRWYKLSKLLKRKQIFLFCDIPDQGFVSGDPDQDNKILRYFVTQGFEFFCNERVGNLVVVAVSNKSLLCIRSQLDIYTRYMWGSPPALGSRVITTILSNPALRMEWKKSLRGMVESIMLTREKVKEKLRLLRTPGSWEHLTGQDGMYGFLGITVEQLDYLVTKKHIYIPMNGLINFTCINSQNIDYITQSINEAVLAIGPGPQPKEPPKVLVIPNNSDPKNLDHMTSETKSLGAKASPLPAYLHSKK